MMSVTVGQYTPFTCTRVPRTNFVVGLIATQHGYRLTDEGGIRTTDEETQRVIDND